MRIKKVRFLSSREIRWIERILYSMYGVECDLSRYLCIMTREGFIRLVSKKYSELPQSNLRAVSIGIYFGRIVKDQVLLSIEGAQMIGKHAVRGIAILGRDAAIEYMLGKDVRPLQEIDCKDDSFVIVMYNSDILGTARLKKGLLQNTVPIGRILPVGVTV